MAEQVFVYDPTVNDTLSKVRGVGRYLQILRENFPKWKYINDLIPLRPSGFAGRTTNSIYKESVFINPFFNFLKPPLTFKRVARKQIAVIHDLIPLKYPKHFPSGFRGRFNIFRNKLALRNYDLIVTDSNASKRDIVKILKFKEEKVRVVYPCLPKILTQVDSSQKLVGRNKENINPDYQLLATSYCLYVGDATWNKNLVNLAKAIKEINVTCVFVGKVFETLVDSSQKLIAREKNINNPNYHLLTNNSLLKHPWQKEFKQFLKEVGNDKKFIFLGFVPDEKLIQLYQNAACNILISRDEGFGFSYIEAASQSCPSLLSEVPVLREISKNKGAIFTDTEKISDIANAIGAVYFNLDLKNKLGKQAKERSRFFSQSKFVNEFNKVLNTL